MGKITFENKVDIRQNDLPRKNTITGGDINEIKNSVNELYESTPLMFKANFAIIDGGGPALISVDDLGLESISLFSTGVLRINFPTDTFLNKNVIVQLTPGTFNGLTNDIIPILNKLISQNRRIDINCRRSDTMVLANSTNVNFSISVEVYDI